jgi:hypothetical protein
MKWTIILLLLIQIAYVLAEKKEVLAISIDINGADSVRSSKREATMIKFTGSINHANFKGKVLTGGVDTQIQEQGQRRTLSARYMLDGTDARGQKCKIFIENNGIADNSGSISNTTPKIITDCKSLEYLEDANLSGTLEMRGMGVFIRVFDEGTPKQSNNNQQNQNQQQNEKCWSLSLGYDCCNHCNVIYTDDSGDWGVTSDGSNWCGIKHSF